MIKGSFPPPPPQTEIHENPKPQPHSKKIPGLHLIICMYYAAYICIDCSESILYNIIAPQTKSAKFPKKPSYFDPAAQKKNCRFSPIFPIPGRKKNLNRLSPKTGKKTLNNYNRKSPAVSIRHTSTFHPSLRHRMPEANRRMDPEPVARCQRENYPPSE